MKFTVEIDCELGKKYYRTDYIHVEQKQHVYIPVFIHPTNIICNHFINGVKQMINGEEYNTHFSPLDWAKQTAPIYWEDSENSTQNI